MFIDEFYFHHKRKLGKWESIGHPIDTFFFLLCFITVLLDMSDTIYIYLAIFSTIIVTKDEFIHSEQSNGPENWLHSLLFILHPISLYTLYLAKTADMMDIVLIQTLVIFCFMLYQILYWNFKKDAYEITSDK